MAKFTCRADYSSFLSHRTRSQTQFQSPVFRTSFTSFQLHQFPSKHHLRFRILSSTKQDVKDSERFPKAINGLRLGKARQKAPVLGVKNGVTVMGSEGNWLPWKNLCDLFFPDMFYFLAYMKKGFEQQRVSITFSKAIFLGNGLVASVFGLFGNVLADSLALGPVAPFDAIACFLAIGMVIILSSWSENYGDPSEIKDLLTQFRGVAVAIASGSMYTFVFLWTPALSRNEEEIPHGFIFATFMLASMLGSSLASRLMPCTSPKVESCMQIIFAVSSASLLLPILTAFLVVPSKEKGGSISFSGCIQLLGFCTFEAYVGIFLPSIMKMRYQFIAEEAEAIAV